MAGLSYRQKPRAVESQPVLLTLPTAQCQGNNRQGGHPLEGILNGAGCIGEEADSVRPGSGSSTFDITELLNHLVEPVHTETTALFTYPKNKREMVTWVIFFKSANVYGKGNT